MNPKLYSELCVFYHKYRMLSREEKQEIIRKRNMEDLKGIPLWQCRKCDHVLFSM